MDENIKSKLEPKLLKDAGYLAGFCKRKKIGVVNSDIFVLTNRKSILNYYFLTHDYNGFLKDMFNGGLILNSKQLEEYERKDFIRCNGEFSVEAYLYSDPEH